MPLVTTIEVDKKAFKSRAYEHDWLSNHGFKVKPHHDIGDDRYYPQTKRKTDPNKEHTLVVPMKAQPAEGLNDPSHVVFVVEAHAKAKRVPKVAAPKEPKQPSVILAPKVPVSNINADSSAPKRVPVKSVKQPSKIRNSKVLIEGSYYYDLNNVKKKGFFNKVGIRDVIDIVNTLYPKTKEEIEVALHKRGDFVLELKKIDLLYYLFQIAAARAETLSKTKPEPEEKKLILSLIRKIHNYTNDLEPIEKKARIAWARSLNKKK